jgi:transglutaminase-like putative cysteine protease
MFLLLAHVSAAVAATAPTTAPISDARRAADDARALLARNAARKPPAFVLETGRTRRVEASLVYVAAAPKMVPKLWIIIAPMPPELPSQRGIKASATPQGTETRETVGLQRPLLLWRLPPDEADNKMVTLHIRYTMELVPRRLAPRRAAGQAPAEATLTDSERQAYSSPNILADFESPAFQKWLDESALRPKADETDLDLARRVFQVIKEKGTFDFKEQMDRRASAVCGALRSDCGGLTAVFVAALRANGVPARQLMGRWAQTADKAEKLEGVDWRQQHIKAEFFAAGIGWVPADISVGVQYDKPPDALRHFGLNDGDFVTLHIDPQVRLETVYRSFKTVTFLQEPIFYVTGSGSSAGAVARSDWQVVPVRMERGGK